MLGLRYDLRAPAFGASPTALYSAMQDQVAFADDHGFHLVQFSEHHDADDGYCPSPLIAASAAAARTHRLRLKISALILPLHDPVRLAEDVAVLDLVSSGRLELVIGAGYRAREFAMFGRQLSDRAALVEDGIRVLREAWSGEEFEYLGRSVRVRPRPAQRPGPPVLLGGGTVSAARRAARIADGFEPSDGAVVQPYLDECARLGRPPGAYRHRPRAPFFMHVAEDPEQAWQEILPHASHDSTAYARWIASAADDSGRTSYAVAASREELERTGLYSVVTPDECVRRILALGPEVDVVLHPLLGGLSPELGWESLQLFVNKVFPRVAGNVGVI